MNGNGKAYINRNGYKEKKYGNESAETGRWGFRWSISRSTVLFRPIVHVTHHIRKKLFFFIRLKSKENLSAIPVEFFPKIVNDRSK